MALVPKLCVIFGVLVCPVAHALDLKCCYEVLKNRSVSYQLSHPPGANCTSTWSDKEVVVVDENGEVDKNIAVHHEANKLIIKPIMDQQPRELINRQDCSQRHAYKVKCLEPCMDAPQTTQAPDHDNIDTSSWKTSVIIAVIIIAVIIITIIVIICCCRQKKRSISNAPTAPV